MLSNVNFQSNLYPVKDFFLSDEDFLSQIHDIFALEILKQKLPVFKMSPLQREEYRAAGVHCTYARKGDYPWGTIIDKSGVKKVVCRCTNTRCKSFKKCRPDFKPSELNVLVEKVPPPPKPKILPPKIFSPPPVKISTPPVKIAPVKVFSPPPVVQSEQEKIINSAPEARIIVSGAPGTGKTHTLAEKIIHMVESGVAPDKIFVFCFSRAATATVRSRLKKKFQEVDIRTFDSFATYMLASQNFSLDGKSYDARISEAVSVLNSTPDIFEEYADGHLIVDEVQDLVGVRAELLLALLKVLPEGCGFTLLGDPCQSIFDYSTAKNPRAMPSRKLYEEIRAQFPEIQRCVLTKNHRQSQALENLTAQYRENILKGAEIANQSLENIRAQIPKLGVKISELTFAQIEKFLQDGTLGILARRNIQALQISSWLNNNEIPHRHRLRRSGENLAAWLAKFFCAYPNATISEKDFLCGGDKWAALIETLPPKSRYEVSEILRALKRNPKNNLLFEIDSEPAPITVSDIHRVKGSEFDSVILIDDILSAKDELEEHKVCYVGLTRARKNLAQIEMEKSYIKFLKDKNQRGYSLTKNRKNIASFEICADDADFLSFAQDSEVQEFILQRLEVGTSLKLKKLPENMSFFVQYEIICEEPEYKILGRTSESFTRDLSKALKEIQNLSYDAQPYYRIYPKTFTELYVDGFISCVSETASVSAAKNFGGMKIWVGLTISGFARAEWGKF